MGSFNQEAVINLTRTADGALSFSDCVTEDAPATTGCADVAPAPVRPTDIAAKADFVAVAVSDGDSISQLSRGAGGTLAFGACVENAPAGAPCSGAGTNAISNPSGVAVTAEGAVYATGSDTDSLIHLEPDGSGGLQFADCVSTDAATTGCTDISATTNVLKQADQLALDPFDENLVASGGASPSRGIANFDIGESGALGFSDCVTSEPTATGCDENIGASTNVLDDNGAGLAVSDDGASVYGAGDAPDSAYRLTRELKVPDTTITSGPSGTITNPRPTFIFVSDEPGSTFSCQVDGGPFVACTSPRTLGPLADGPHTFSVFATDSDGREDPTPASRSFTVDTTNPDTTVEGSARAKKKQRQKGRKVVVKVVATAGEMLEAKGSARFKFRLNQRAFRLKAEKVAKGLGPGESKNLKLKPGTAKDQRRIVKALKRRKKPAVRLTVRLTDEAGNTKTFKEKVKLRR